MSGSIPAGPSRKVLFCIGTHNLWGGIEHWLTGLARCLDAQGWTVRVGLARGKHFNDPDAFRRAHPGIDSVEFDGRTGTPEGRIRAVSKVLRKLRPDIVLPVGLAEVFHAAARVKQSGQALRVLAPLRATSPELLGDMAAFAPVIDMCIGNNPLHAQFLEGRGIFPADRLGTAINGVELPSSERVRQQEDRSVPRLLFVGRLHPQHKRILDLPMLLEELERRQVQYRLTIVGDGEGRERLLQQLGDRMVKGIVRFLGYLPPERIAREVYPEHDVLIHFSAAYGEGCPQVLQQAMAHGVVPLCSEFLGIHSLGFLRNGETCCSFPTGDIARAADQLEKLHRQPDLLPRLARAGQEAMRKFPMAKVLQDWEKAMERVLSLPIRGMGLREGQIPPVAQGQSRIERLGVPPAVADWIRRTLRRFPEFPDGWAEWPGTLTALEPSAHSAMLAELSRLDSAARPMEKNAIADT